MAADSISTATRAAVITSTIATDVATADIAVVVVAVVAATRYRPHRHRSSLTARPSAGSIRRATAGSSGAPETATSPILATRGFRLISSGSTGFDRATWYKRPVAAIIAIAT
jgi:hypothetical protein